MNKKNIEEFAVNSRRQLIENLTYEANKIGITKEGIQKPDNIAEDMQTFTASGVTNTIYGKQIEQRQQLIKEIENNGFDQTIEKIAYTWFNRIIAIRFMEINNYLPTKTRVLSSINPEKKEPDIITEALNIDLDYTNEDKKTIYQLKEENNTDELFKLLFIKQCNKLNEILPELFETIDDYTELLFNIQLSNQNNIINKLINIIPEEDFKNQVEIIGWLYQYYNKELKDEIIDINKSSILKEDIPAATQLFTPDWIVKYMVENSLGKYYIEHNSNSNLKEKFEYLLKDTLEEKNKKINIENLKFFDSCMGSGHILSYAFDVFMKIYEELGYYKKEIPQLILENNLFGADIDERSYQLTYFSLLLKARKYDKKIFEKNIRLKNIIVYKDSNISEDLLNNLKKYDKILYEDIVYLNNCFKNSKEYGSLIQIKKDINLDVINKKINEYFRQLSNSLLDLNIKLEFKESIRHLIKETIILTSKYEFVVTNPPYMNKLNQNYKNFSKKYYKDYSSDLYSMFIYRNTLFCKKGGYCAYMTPFIWMFNKNYQKLRVHIINNLNISSLIQLEYSAFSEATVPICTFIIYNSKKDNGTFIRLSEFKGGMDLQKQKYLESLNTDVPYKYHIKLSKLKNIPTTPISYWINKNFINKFKNERKLSEIADVKVGLQTGNNEKFLRLWFEVNVNDIEFNCKSTEELKISKKWFPLNKGGFYRKWYGNQEYIINWQNNGKDVRNFKKSVIRNEKYYYKEAISWSKVSSGNISFRFFPSSFIFDSTGASIFTNHTNYILGLLNSSISQYILNLISPTIDYEIGTVSNIPIILNKLYKNEIDKIVKENIQICKKDWDEKETSWNFKKHPLLGNHSLIENYYQLKKYKEKQFNLLKNNEIRLNKIFVNIYDDNSIKSEISDKEVSINKIKYEDMMKNFISYVVGALFGRYSLDKKGLTHAGGIFNIENYHSFIPYEDNIIPILDQEYFENDIVNKFIEFIEIAFDKENLNADVDFIANALNKKGKTSKEIIRNYFINDFYKNHIKMYSAPRRKAPIYWMFDSGKQNAFKCLIYMHRYEPDLVSRIRFDYLHKTQRAIEENIKRQDNIINNSQNKAHIKKANKEKTKLVKQLDEIKIYDLALAHVANERIEIDLDDGVKVNYAKFQNIEVVDPKTNKNKKINLLAKL